MIMKTKKQILLVASALLLILSGIYTRLLFLLHAPGLAGELMEISDRIHDGTGPPA